MSENGHGCISPIGLREVLRELHLASGREGQCLLGVQCPQGSSLVGDECRVYSCASEHGAEYCGVCGEFPCDLLMNYYDLGNPEGPRNAAIRVAVNAIRAKHGDEKTLEYLEKTGPLNKPAD